MSERQEFSLTSTADDPKIFNSAKNFELWVRQNLTSVVEATGKKQRHFYRRVVETISYEIVCEEKWPEEWFQNGIVAFTLIALETEGQISLYREPNENVWIKSKDKFVSLKDFIQGDLAESVKGHPEFKGLNPIEAMSCTLSEYPNDEW
ncbi:MAG: hypothetical protein KDA65_00750 [Planctomycetaceae bacterium]|nr:hypothetical protein [Planctomycetaceae bacterium]